MDPQHVVPVCARHCAVGVPDEKDGPAVGVEEVGEAGAGPVQHGEVVGEGEQAPAVLVPGAPVAAAVQAGGQVQQHPQPGVPRPGVAHLHRLTAPLGVPTSFSPVRCGCQGAGWSEAVHCS